MRLVGILILAACSSSRPSPPEVCKQVCRKLSSCSSTGSYDDCVTGFHCADQTDEKVAACEYDCLSKPSCSSDYTACRDRCLFANSCAPDCLTCASDEACFGGAIPNTTIVGFAAECRKKCQSTDDCKAGEHCVLEVSIFGQRAGRVCLPENEARCDQSLIGQCVGPTLCSDGETLQRTYFANQAVCGGEFIHCANGCEGDTTDGGVDGGVTARCR